MESTPSFDVPEESLYNQPKDAYGSEPIRIDRRTLKPLNDPHCQHEYEHDPEDADNSDKWKVHKCRNCPVGFIEQL